MSTHPMDSASVGFAAPAWGPNPRLLRNVGTPTPRPAVIAGGFAAPAWGPNPTPGRHRRRLRRSRLGPQPQAPPERGDPNPTPGRHRRRLRRPAWGPDPRSDGVAGPSDRLGCAEALRRTVPV